MAAIENAQVLDERFARPAKFDLASFWGESTRRFEQGVYRDFATLRVSPLGLERLRNFSPIVAQAAQRSAGPPDASGWRQVTVPIESVEHASREMLRLGAEGVVLEPSALREAVCRTAQKMFDSYEGAALHRRAPRSAR